MPIHVFTHRENVHIDVEILKDSYRQNVRQTDRTVHPAQPTMATRIAMKTT